MNSSPSVEVALTAFAFGGEVLGRLPDGRAVFVPFALPGEVVRVRLVEERKRYARAELLEVLTPSAQRISPRCQHFTTCGGCHYQHMPYPDQLRAKRDILRDQLERIGGLSEPRVRPMVPSPREWNYRNHVQFHLDAQGQLGYYKARSPEVFPLQECHLPEDMLNEIWPQLEFEPGVHIARVGLRIGMGEDVQMILESDELDPPELSVQDLPVSVSHLSPAGALVLAGSASIQMQVLGRSFQVSAGSFFQVNSHMAGMMVEHILEHLALTPGMVILDLYCGVGLFSAFLAPQAGHLIGIESSPSACEDYVLNLDEFENVKLYEAPVEDALPTLDVQPDVVLVDPPRAGIDRYCLDAIVQVQPQKLVYVSCDPATLSRDAGRLSKAGYHLDHVAPFDLFPQTYHIESISFWVL